MNMAVLNHAGDEGAMPGIALHTDWGRYGITTALVLCVLALVVWLGLLLQRPDFLPVQNVRIAGEFRQLQPDSLQSTVIDTVRGGFFNVNVDVIRQVLMQEPWVQDVSVKRIWPDTITVSITEREAVARWGDSGLISSKGEFFSPAALTETTELPILHGPDNAHDLVLQHYREFSQELADSGLSISRLVMNERRSWTAYISGGPELILGRTEIRSRMQRFTLLANSSLKVNLPDIETVDLRYTNGFAVRWRQISKDTEKGLDNHG